MKNLFLTKLTAREKETILSDFFDDGLCETDGGLKKVCVDLEGETVEVFLVAKSLCNSGWSWRPEIKRIQVKNYSNIAIKGNSKNRIMVYIGIFRIEEKWLIAVWNAFEYMKARTIVSCYVMQDLLFEAYQNDYAMSKKIDHSVFVCTKKGIRTLLSDFIKENALLSL